MKENKASSTAFTVLQGIMFIAKHSPHHYLVEDEMRRLGDIVLSGSEEGRARLKQLDKLGLSIAVKLREFIFLPGITLHYILRKRCVETKTREAIANGAKQIINLGAGFDSLALRLSKEYPEINFIEIDHPDTQNLKVSAFKSEAETAHNFHYLSVDFTHQNIQNRLAEFDKFKPDLATLFICEGVLMYLTEEEIDSLFASIRTLTKAGTKLLFTAIEPQGSPRNNIRNLLFLYLKIIGEPIKWALDSAKLDGFLDEQHCRLLSMDNTVDFKKNYMRPGSNITLHHGEYVVLAEFN